MQLSVIFGNVECEPRPDYAPRAYEDRKMVGGRESKGQPSRVIDGVQVMRQIDIGRRVLRVEFSQSARYADIGVVG